MRAGSLAGWSGERLKSNFVKIFVDGVIDSGTAFMLEDYADLPGVKGDPLFTAEMMNEACLMADKFGFQIAVHAIGDAGVRRTLDAFELAQRRNGTRDSRHPIEHIEVIHPDDIPRFKQLGVIASMQPLHPPSPLLFPELPTLGRIGDKRLPYAYAWRTLKDAGARIVYASDWPVAPLPPLMSIQAAVTRKPYRPGLADAVVAPRHARRLHARGRLCRVRRAPEGHAEARHARRHSHALRRHREDGSECHQGHDGEAHGGRWACHACGLTADRQLRTSHATIFRASRDQRRRAPLHRHGPPDPSHRPVAGGARSDAARQPCG